VNVHRIPNTDQSWQGGQHFDRFLAGVIAL
jgi:hypothetical protein